MSSVLLDRARPATDRDAFASLVAGLAPVAFAGADDVESMRDRLVAQLGIVPGDELGYAEGQKIARLSLSGGVLGLRVQSIREWTPAATAWEREQRDLLRSARTLQRAGLLDDPWWLERLEVTKAREITSWSAASRARMVRAIAELDYSRWADDGGDLAMVTLTLPGSWQTLAPNGRAFKGLMEAFRKRWTRAVGSWRGLWKLEFQRRGAPHVHYLLRVPALIGGKTAQRWISDTWAEVCRDSISDPEQLQAYVESGEYRRHLAAGTAVDFSGMRFSDPRRTAIYFLKHSSKTKDDKEYQHIVPGEWRGEGAGPGRFWGYVGLKRSTAELTLDWDDFHRARRILRHVAGSRQSATAIARINARVRSGELSAAEGRAELLQLRRPKVRSLGASGGGWVLVNDALTLAWDVGRALSQP